MRKLFIRNYADVADRKVRMKHGLLAGAGGIIINLLLFSFKLLIGMLTFSLSIISDAINNLSDFFSCFVSIIGFKMAGKPADKGHPYGHERIEYIAGMIVSLVMVGAAVLLGYNSVVKLLDGGSDTEYNIWAFAVLAAAVVIKLFLGYFYYGLGKAIDSVSLKASRTDSLNDAVATSVVMIAAIVQYFVPNLWWIDGGMSLAVSCFILYSGIKMVVETASPLLGAPADKDFVNCVINDIMSYNGALGVHDVMCHAYGPTKKFMTAHVEVDGYADTFATHELIDKIEKELGNKYGLLLTLHMDPLDTKCEKLAALKSKLSVILSEIDACLTFHDLRMVEGNDTSNIVFDILIPADCKLSPEFISAAVNEKINEIDPDYTVVLTLDNDY